MCQWEKEEGQGSGSLMEDGEAQGSGSLIEGEAQGSRSLMGRGTEGAVLRGKQGKIG